MKNAPFCPKIRHYGFSLKKFFLTTKIWKRSGQIETKIKSIPPFYPQLWSKVLVIFKNAIFYQFLCLLWHSAIIKLYASKLKTETSYMFCLYITCQISDWFQKVFGAQDPFCQGRQVQFSPNLKKITTNPPLWIRNLIFFTNSYCPIYNTHNCQVLDRSYMLNSNYEPLTTLSTVFRPKNRTFLDQNPPLWFFFKIFSQILKFYNHPDKMRPKPSKYHFPIKSYEQKDLRFLKSPKISDLKTVFWPPFWNRWPDPKKNA